MPIRSKAKGRRESGSYVALPHSLLRHPNFASLSPRATKLFLDLASCYVGNNNGDFSCAWRQMKSRGWTSKDQLYKSLRELRDTGFAIATRQGGSHKCALYALTIWAIDDCKGKLDVASTTVAPATWKKSFSAVRHTDRSGPPGGPKSAEMGAIVPSSVRHTGQSA